VLPEEKVCTGMVGKAQAFLVLLMSKSNRSNRVSGNVASCPGVSDPNLGPETDYSAKSLLVFLQSLPYFASNAGA
jgi:hypothetical protein